jgi:hypothetical protein
MLRLDEFAFLDRPFNLRCAHEQELPRQLFQKLQIIGVDIVPLVLGEAVEKNASLLHAVGNDGAESAGPAPAIPRNPLLDKVAAKRGVNAALLRAADRFAQPRIPDLFLSCKPCKLLGFENLQIRS